jgi:AmmeMemoRadiSam system protein B
MTNTRKVFRIVFLSLLLGLTTISVYKISQLGGKAKGDSTEKFLSRPHGLIVPHHHLPAPILSQAYRRLPNDYDLAVILGPNHFYPDTKQIITSNDNPFDNPQVNRLKKSLPFIQTNNDLIKTEHSITVQADYLSRYLPNTNILPLVLSPNVPKKDLNQLITYLTNLSDRTLFIASVDFAHDLNYLPALSNNQQSIKAIKTFDYKKISQFTNTHLDSPESIITFLKIMQKKDSKKMTVLNSTHGALLTDNPALVGTSYVTATFSPQ